MAESFKFRIGDFFAKVTAYAFCIFVLLKHARTISARPLQPGLNSFDDFRIWIESDLHAAIVSQTAFVRRRKRRAQSFDPFTNAVLYGIFRQGFRPATGIAEAALGDIKIQTYLPARRLHIENTLLPATMASKLQILPIVMKSAHPKRNATGNSYAASLGIREFHPPYVASHTVVLRTSIRNVKFRYGRPVASQKSRCAAIRVVLVRAAPIPCYICKSAIKYPTCAETRQFRHFSVRHNAV